MSRSSAGDGAGTSGPDSGGIAIPTRLDKAYDWEQIESAIQLCDGNLLKSLAQQISFADVNDKDLYQQSSLNIRQPYRLPKEKYVSGYTKLYLPCRDGSLPAQYKETFNTSLNFQKNPSLDDEVSFHVGTICARSQEDHRLSAVFRVEASEVPRIALTVVSDIPFYNDLGEVLSHQRIVNDVRIITQNQPRENVPLYRTYDGLESSKEEKIKTKVTINTQEYFNCLVTELQK